jgi:hypothetical protein
MLRENVTEYPDPYLCPVPSETFDTVIVHSLVPIKRFLVAPSPRVAFTRHQIATPAVPPAQVP